MQVITDIEVLVGVHVLDGSNGSINVQCVRRIGRSNTHPLVVLGEIDACPGVEVAGQVPVMCLGVDTIGGAPVPNRHKGGRINQAGRDIAEVESRTVVVINANSIVTGGILDQELGGCGCTHDMQVS